MITCKKLAQQVKEHGCSRTPEFSTDGKILWPAFTVEPGHKVG